MESKGLNVVDRRLIWCCGVSEMVGTHETVCTDVHYRVILTLMRLSGARNEQLQVDTTTGLPE